MTAVELDAHLLRSDHSSAGIARGRAPCSVSPDGQCYMVSMGIFPDKSGRVGPQEVVRCRYCGGAVTLPTLSDVAFLYDNRESQDFQPDSVGFVRKIKRLAFDRQVSTLLAQLPERPGRILDFGCGSGLFTHQLARRFGPGVVIGSDFHHTPPAELDVGSYVPMAELSKFEGTFDLVLAMHVLEHDDDALGLLARIAAMAKPGGTVVVEVPNVECVWTQVMGRAWDAWYVPFHRTHFSRKSLLSVMEVGCLAVSAVHSVTVPTMGRSLANLMHAKNGLPFILAGIALHPLQWACEKLSGRSSALRVIARIAG